MKEISAEEKDKVLDWFYEADVYGKETPQETLPNNSREICAILTNDGYITNGEFRSVLTMKGQSFKLNGGYVNEREEKKRTIRVAEEANKKAHYANILSFLAIIVSVLSLIFTHCSNKGTVNQTDKTETINTDSPKVSTITVISQGKQD